MCLFLELGEKQTFYLIVNVYEVLYTLMNVYKVLYTSIYLQSNVSLQTFIEIHERSCLYQRKQLYTYVIVDVDTFYPSCYRQGYSRGTLSP